MAADVALDTDLRSIYPFNRLSGPANVLVMPGLHAASISSKILQKLGGGSVIGPLLIGMEKSVQIVGMNSTVSELVTHASLAAHEAIKPTKPKRARKAAKKPARKKR
jgi:malate dehydrogenase (oxaloacetate-decarboxylating)(NADP+)